MELKQYLPWWFKMGAKIALSRVPLPYGFWRSLGLFKHGDMACPKRALVAFRAHFERAVDVRPVVPGFVCLELGPGDSLLSGLVARAFGASRSFLVDGGNYAVRDTRPYVALVKLLREAGYDVPPVDRCDSLEAILALYQVTYLTNGVRSLAEIPDGGVDYSWSQATLEHVARDEFQAMLQELRRVTHNEGVGSHSIDLRDHLGGALNNLRFTDSLWESVFFRRSGFYTNRIRYSEMLSLLHDVGFDVRVVRTSRWEALPTPRHAMAERFASLDDDELQVAEFEIVMWPRDDGSLRSAISAEIAN